jgi:hypothetical protein
MSTQSTLYIGNNTHVLEVLGLQDHVGTEQSDAIVQLLSITASDGSAVSGVSVPIVLAHISNGDYRNTLPAGGAFVAGRKYTATFHAAGSQGFVGEWTESLIAKRRAA